MKYLLRYFHSGTLFHHLRRSKGKTNLIGLKFNEAVICMFHSLFWPTQRASHAVVLYLPIFFSRIHHVKAIVADLSKPIAILLQFDGLGKI